MWNLRVYRQSGHSLPRSGVMATTHVVQCHTILRPLVKREFLTGFRPSNALPFT